MNAPTPPYDKQPRRPRILFVGEAVTLAHVARPFALARALNSDDYEVVFACDARYNKLLGKLPFPWRPLHTIAGERFLDALARGNPLYDTATLRGYVEEELALLREVEPDVVIGDFRLSLAVSAPLTRTCHLAITNAYWSPFARQRFPVPELPMVRFLGVTAAGILFRLARPLAFAYHTLPLNRLRREYGLPSLGLDLRRVYTHADYTLYADVPQLAPTEDLPENHLYLGPILWSPAQDPPPWWNTMRTDRPIIYVTMGSSGGGSNLPRILEALAELPVTVVAATAGRDALDRLPANALVADYLPGEEAANRSCLVICNGGSPTTQQALAAGRPVLGIPSNLDQYLNMQAIQRSGSGELVRAGRARVPTIRRVVTAMLGQPAYRNAAAKLAECFARYPAPSNFATFLRQRIVGRAGRGESADNPAIFERTMP